MYIPEERDIPNLINKLELEQFPKAFFRKLSNKRFRIICFVSLLFLFLLLFCINKKKERSEMLQVDFKHREKCIAFINRVAEDCLKLKTRKEQNKAFAKTKTDLPIKPIKMTTTTAVWLYKPGEKDMHVIKRVIFRPDSPTQEAHVSFMLKHVNVMKTFGTATSWYTNDDGSKDKLIWIFSEYLSHKISHSSVARNEETIRDILRGVLHGLVYMHDVMETVHLDLKIANVMGQPSKNGEIVYKLIDFGYSRELKRERKRNEDGDVYINGKSFGTYPYKAPEVVLKNVHGKASDIWCCGAIAWFLSCEETPFYKEDREKDNKKWLAFLRGKIGHEFNSDMSEEIKNFISVCMRRNSKKRPTAKELLTHPFIQGITNNNMKKRSDSVDSDSGIDMDSGISETKSTST